MDRLAKRLRVSCGLILFLNLAAFFFPLVRITQSNYPDINFSQMDYCISMFQGRLPQRAAMPETAIMTSQMLMIIVVMILPLLLSLIAGIWGIAGSPGQLVTSVGALVICICYGVLFGMTGHLCPEIRDGQECVYGLARILHIIVSGLAVLLGIAAMIVSPRRRREAPSPIPQVQEIKEEKEQSKYNVLETVSGSGDQNMNFNEKDITSHLQGVLTGITGPYAGARIPFEEGESIRLGRLPDNDLVFEGQGRVSRRHCVLTWHGSRGKFCILDHSSNGSYINGSDECLPQNIEIWLEPGTILDIGSEDNRFRLE